MINAELNHNPYLLQTQVKFNGQSPRINCQVEKYQNKTLKDWIEKVPQIFHDEMNGYDFDLYFTGTKSDYENLCDTFLQAEISQEMVRLFHKNELEDAETKSQYIDSLIQWLRENPNRKFDFNVFYSDNTDLFEGAYPYIIINGSATESIHSQVSMELIKNINELQNAVLTNTPILFFIDPKLTKEFRKDLMQVLKRKDVKQNQLFFMIHPQLNADQIERVIIDLGVEKPQIVTSYDSDEVLNFLCDYPITEFVRESIIIFEEIIGNLSEVLDSENKNSEIQNAEIHAVISDIESQISLLKEVDLSFTERDNLNAELLFSDSVRDLEDQIIKWKNRKIKVVGELDCDVAAADYNSDVDRFMSAFSSSVNDTYKLIAKEILSLFRKQYAKQGLELDFEPNDIELKDPVMYQPVSLIDELLSLKEVTYEEQKYDVMSLFRISGTAELKEPLRVVTCYYSQWRKRTLEIIIPAAKSIVRKNAEQLCDYYNELAESFHKHLSEMIVMQESEKEKVLAQLSDDERKLQEDNDWLAEFKDKLVRIERG